MKIHIRIDYITASGTKVMQRGNFRVDKHKDIEEEITRVAYDWLKKIRKEMFVDNVVSILVDDEFNITDEVLALDESPRSIE